MNGVSDHEGLTHRHAPARRHGARRKPVRKNLCTHKHTCLERRWKRSMCARLHREVCTQMHLHTPLHSHTHKHTLTHLAGIEELLCLHTSPSSALILLAATKPALKLGKQKHNKEAKRGQQAASILLPPSLPSSLPLALCAPNVYLPPCWKEKKRGMWTDRVRKERNLAEGKRAKAFKVCHRAVTKAF